MNNNEPYTKGVYSSLFITSYFPLFLFIIIRQINSNYPLLSQKLDVYSFFISFGLSIFLIILSIYGFIGTKIFLLHIKERNLTANKITIIDIDNKNSEVLSYIGTYIIPFVFQSYSTLWDNFSILILLFIIYVIFKKSSLIQINPILSFRYSIYQIEYVDTLKPSIENKKKAIIITKEKYLNENDIVKFTRLEHKLFFVTLIK